MTRRWLGSADVEIDDTSGALLVKIDDAEFNDDLPTGALVGLTRVTLGESATLAELLAAGQGDTQIVAEAKRVALIPVADAVANICRDGTRPATTDDPALPAGGIELGAEGAAEWGLVGVGCVDVWQTA